MTNSNSSGKVKVSPSSLCKKVLVADDNPVVRRGLQIHLEKWGYTVIEAKDGEAAYHLLATDHAIRLAIIDWNMPKLSGLELCRRLRAQPLAERPYIYCIMFTGRSDGEKDQMHALVAGADIFLNKPSKPSLLRAILLVGGRIVEAMEAYRGLGNSAESAAPLPFLKEIEIKDGLFL